MPATLSYGFIIPTPVPNPKNQNKKIKKTS